MIEQKSHLPSEYQEKHKLASEFASRSEYLDHELTIMAPRRWRLNLPGRDFRFEIEDLVPAISGPIGKVIMTTAIVKAFAAGSRIALIVVAGGHPLALGFVVGVFGLILGLIKGGSRLIGIAGIGVRGGLLVYIGATGLIGQVYNLRNWSDGIGNGPISMVVILLIRATYAILTRMKKRWMAIPISALVAGGAAYMMGAPFKFPGNTLSYDHTKVRMDVDDTMIVASIRQMVGSVLGGGNLTSSWALT